MNKVVLPDDCYSKYRTYITNNEYDLFDIFFCNNLDFTQYRNQIKGDLKSAMGKKISSLSGN